MKTYTYIYRTLLCLSAMILCLNKSNAQEDTTSFHKRHETSENKLNMDAIYDRPFLSIGSMPLAIGGYLETNMEYSQTNGKNDGTTFQFRRMTLFFSSTISEKIKFLSEIEFEAGTKEINIEFAAADFEFHPIFNIRGGIVMNPIGSYNQNHDGPKWDFIDRPISSTNIIPSTLSNVGFGIHGKYYTKVITIGYEAYLTNGFNDNIISNNINRTSLAAGKIAPDKFEENVSGLPLFTGKIALKNREIAEIGLSCMSGVYNRWKDEGLIIDDKRTVTVLAFDMNTSLFDNKLNIIGELAKVFVDIPETYSQQFGSKQLGFYLDIVGTIFQGMIFERYNSILNMGLRFEYVDYNQGTFNETGDNIADEQWSIVGSLAFRPVGSTVVRANYRYMEHKDIFGNPPSRTGTIQLGFSSYF